MDIAKDPLDWIKSYAIVFQYSIHVLPANIIFGQSNSLSLASMPTPDPTHLEFDMNV